MSSMDSRSAKRRKASHQLGTHSSVSGSSVHSFETRQSSSSFQSTPRTTPGIAAQVQSRHLPAASHAGGRSRVSVLEDGVVHSGAPGFGMPLWDPQIEDGQYFPTANFDDINIEELAQGAVPDAASVGQWLMGDQGSAPPIAKAGSATDGNGQMDTGRRNDIELFPLSGWPNFQIINEDTTRKRVRETAEFEHQIASAEMADLSRQGLTQDLAMLFPSSPDPYNKSSYIRNPFLGGHEERFTTLDGRALPVIPKGGTIDGYIKIQVSNMFAQDTSSPSSVSFRVRYPTKRYGSNWPDNGAAGDDAAITPLPPNFATGLELNGVDRSLWVFHLEAYCPGRMLLPNNYWSEELIPMATKYECTRHALFCFTASYALDYQPTEAMRERANFHYRKAVSLVDELLTSTETYQVGKEDAVVAAIILLFSNDIVNWENRRPKGREPLWREGARAARTILDRTDPGYRYWNMANVQSSNARLAHANWVAYVDILAQPVSPLEDEHTESSFKWLLEGTMEEVHRIQGITGLCPKLLHMFATITHFAARLVKCKGTAQVVIMGANRLRTRLDNFSQWSDFASGYKNFQDLLDTCPLDGTVNDAGKVTALSAQAYVYAAEIYLNCRFYRKPRSHPDVCKSVNDLAECIRRLPCSGPLFTSQSPFFAVFIMAVAAHRPEHRKVATDWFNKVLEGASCRSSVPPVWEAMQGLWSWMDQTLHEEPQIQDLPVQSRPAWWEDMVGRLMQQSGVVSLV